MSKRKKFCIVYLTGGLGNQLFQLAHGCYQATDGIVALEWKLGKPRLNSAGLPEVMSFDLPSNIKLLDSKDNKFVSKTINFVLKYNLSEKKTNLFLNSILKISASIIVSFHFRRILIFEVSKGVGFDSDKKFKKNAFLVGYFQSDYWIASDECKALRSILRTRSESTTLKELRVLAQIEKPLIVHVRLGDYKNESKIGVLSHSYYKKAINLQWETGKYKKLWVFSDEIESVTASYFDLDKKNLRFFSDVVNSTCQTFEVMRLGQGYVIANSTFSWWSAYLCLQKNVTIYAPSPWFHYGKSPVKIIPNSWFLIPGWDY